MSSWHFYEASSGQFMDRAFSGPAHGLRANTPAGHVAWFGDVDFLSQKMDVETGKLVDYQPPRPSEKHYWHTARKRWLLDPIIEANRAREVEILQAIKGIDERVIRPMLELQLNPDDADAQKIRTKLMEEKSKLRAELRAVRENL